MKTNYISDFLQLSRHRGEDAPQICHKGMTLSSAYTEHKVRIKNTVINMAEGHDDNEFSKKLFAEVVKTKEFKNNNEAAVCFNPARDVLGIQNRVLKAEVYFEERKKVREALFERRIRRSWEIRAIWGRPEDSSVILLTIIGISSAVSDTALILCLQAWGTLLKKRDQFITWDKDGQTNWFTGTRKA
jgi:hypothetical protein